METSDIQLFSNLYEDFKPVRKAYVGYVENKDYKNRDKLREKFKDDEWVIKKFDDIDKEFN